MRYFRIGAPVVAFALLASSASFSSHIQAGVASAPNVVIILTDDQRWDSIWPMTTVQNELVTKGMTFTNALVENPWCCPSRSSILTGKYSHTTKVYRNSPPYGGFKTFKTKDSSTLATWLAGAGYRNALVGKYLNGYFDPTYIPPGWDRWVAFCCDKSNTEEATRAEGGAYYDYNMSIDGVQTSFGHDSGDYSTDVLASFATSFIESTPSAQPLFLFFTPYASHSAAIAAPRHVGHFSKLSIAHRSNFNEEDVTDKPQYVSSLPSLSTTDQAKLDKETRKQLDTLLAVDDAVNVILQALSDTDRLDNTILVFASDQGLTLGEHRIKIQKMAPYEEVIRIPLVIRFDRLPHEQRSDDHLVLNLDLAQTIAEFAGVPAPGVEGRSLVPLLTEQAGGWRSDFLLEHLQGAGIDPVPTYCGVRTESSMYAQYSTGEEELYDLTDDPYELRNLAADPSAAAALNANRARVHELCHPLPPGFSFTY